VKKEKMKTKTKTLVVVEIAIVLCSLFLVAIPAIVADQNQETQKASASTITTASEDDYVLEIYGNANEDDTIDMGDVVYTKLAIFGKKPKTELCDAKYDGRINVLDVIQTKLIILGKEKEITVIDTTDRIVTVNKPIRRVVITFPHQLETLRSLKVPKDKIVGITKDRWDEAFFTEFSDVPSVGWRWTPDIEVILSLHPDTVILFGTSRHDTLHNALESADPKIALLHFMCSDLLFYREEVEKLGYVFDKEDEAEELLDFIEKGCLNPIEEKVETILEEDKPKVYFESRKYSIHNKGQMLIRKGGGKDIFADITQHSGSVDPEAVIDRDPVIIVRAAPYTAGGYSMDVDNTPELKEVREEVMGRLELQNVAAVKTERVYIITVHLLGFYPTSGCRQFVSVAYMAKWLHPELFEDLDPKAIHQEYLTRFQGMDIDLDKKGVFVYPEPS
jgi:iron complex transport system substrate-binding protein